MYLLEYLPNGHYILFITPCESAMVYLHIYGYLFPSFSIKFTVVKTINRRQSSSINPLNTLLYSTTLAAKIEFHLLQVYSV